MFFTSKSPRMHIPNKRFVCSSHSNTRMIVNLRIFVEFSFFHSPPSLVFEITLFLQLTLRQNTSFTHYVKFPDLMAHFRGFLYRVCPKGIDGTILPSCSVVFFSCFKSIRFIFAHCVANHIH